MVQNLYNNPGDGLGSGVSREPSVVDDIQMYLNHLRLNVSGVDESTNHNKAYKIMGVAAHVVGDIYAHRTKVTGSMLGQFIKGDFKNYDSFVSEVNAGGVEFRGVGEYLRIDDKNKYEDSIKIVPSRYDYSKDAVGKLLRDGSSYDFRTHNFDLSVLSHVETLYPY